MIRFGAIVAWVATAILFSFAAWQVVQATEEQITDSPSAPVVIAEGLDSSTTTPLGQGSAGSLPLVPPSNAVSRPSSTTTSTPPIGGPVTTDGPLAPTSSDPNSETRIIETAAGTVSVAYWPGEVHFEGASPAIGWTVEVENEGPQVVEVKFEQDESDVEVKVEWEDGQLVVEVDEESDD